MAINPKLLAQIQTAIDYDEYEVATLVEVLKLLDDQYSNSGDATFSDAQYDTLHQYVKMVDSKNDYFYSVGSAVRGGKVALPNAMGSLTQIYNDNDFSLWFTKHGLTSTTKFCITEKLDGMSASLHYDNSGKLRIAYSRGNGTEGADITRHLKHIVPKLTAVDGSTNNLEVRCEVIISKANFEKVKHLVFRKDGSEYKNPRNMISGLMNSSDIPEVAYKHIDVVVYHNWNETDHKLSQLQTFKHMGFLVPSYTMNEGSNINDTFLTTLLTKLRASSQYEIDGIVIEVDDCNLRNRLNPSKATLNPEYARKYKTADISNNAIATVDFVEWRVSKRGYIKPRVHLVPFPLCGVTITHASGFNADFIVSNGIGPGAKVNMVRSGDVVPNIVGVVERSKLTTEEIEDQLTDVGDWEWNETRVDAVLTGEHANVGLKLAEAFFTAIGVDGLKVGNLKKMFECGFDCPANIINATADELGFAIASQITADGIYASLHKQLHSVTLPQFMGATGLFGRGIGQRKIQKLYDVYGQQIVDNLDIQSAIAVEGFDEKSGNKFINGLPAYRAFYEEVKNHVKFIEPVVVEGGRLNGFVGIFTGFRNKELKAKIEQHGGQVVDSYSKKVTCVIAADPEEQSGKMTKARADRTRIVGLSDIEELFN